MPPVISASASAASHRFLRDAEGVAAATAAVCTTETAPAGDETIAGTDGDDEKGIFVAVAKELVPADSRTSGGGGGVGFDSGAGTGLGGASASDFGAELATGDEAPTFGSTSSGAIFGFIIGAGGSAFGNSSTGAGVLASAGAAFACSTFAGMAEIADDLIAVAFASFVDIAEGTGASALTGTGAGLATGASSGRGCFLGWSDDAEDFASAGRLGSDGLPATTSGGASGKGGNCNAWGAMLREQWINWPCCALKIVTNGICAFFCWLRPRR